MHANAITPWHILTRLVRYLNSCRGLQSFSSGTLTFGTDEASQRTNQTMHEPMKIRVEPCNPLEVEPCNLLEVERCDTLDVQRNLLRCDKPVTQGLEARRNFLPCLLRALNLHNLFYQCGSFFKWKYLNNSIAYGYTQTSSRTLR